MAKTKIAASLPEPFSRGGEKTAFALAASIVGKCHFCVGSHYALLKKEGLTTQQLRDIGRIAAVVNAAAQVIVAG